MIFNVVPLISLELRGWVPSATSIRYFLFFFRAALISSVELLSPTGYSLGR